MLHTVKKIINSELKHLCIPQALSMYLSMTKADFQLCPYRRDLGSWTVLMIWLLRPDSPPEASITLYSRYPSRNAVSNLCFLASKSDPQWTKE